jgi:hypothetical protein
LDRAKQREWCKRGKSEKYLKLKKEFDLKFQKAAETYLEKNVRELKEADPGRQGSRKLEPLGPPVPDKSHLVGQNEI